MLIKPVDEILSSFLPLKIGANPSLERGEARGMRRGVLFGKQQHIMEFEHSCFVGPTST